MIVKSYKKQQKLSVYTFYLKKRPLKYQRIYVNLIIMVYLFLVIQMEVICSILNSVILQIDQSDKRKKSVKKMHELIIQKGAKYCWIKEVWKNKTKLNLCLPKNAQKETSIKNIINLFIYWLRTIYLRVSDMNHFTYLNKLISLLVKCNKYNNKHFIFKLNIDFKFLCTIYLIFLILLVIRFW